MKKYLLLLFALAILTISCNKADSTNSQPTNTEFFRNSEFHQKYKLSEVVIFSRHNIRAPMATPGSFISTVTPYTWHDFGVNASELTEKGGILETINGQFFYKWLVNEELFSEITRPSEEEIYILSNSKQRTIATAEYFLKGFMPTMTIPVNHTGNFDDMDPEFALSLGADITDAQWAQIRSEYADGCNEEAIRKASQALQSNYDLLSNVIDLKNSPAYKEGSFTGFDNYNSKLTLSVGDEPRLDASINKAYSIVDALILQYYEEQDLQKVAFGKKLTLEQWQMLAKILKVHDDIRFYSPFVQHYVSQHQRNIIAQELQKQGRKFSYICGHDTNILNILKSLKTKEYNIPDAVELGTPIGSKIVFEKWVNASGKEFIGVNHVYQTIDQLRGNTPLDLTTTPNCIRLQFEGLQANEDGLYPINVMIERLTENPY